MDSNNPSSTKLNSLRNSKNSLVSLLQEALGVFFIFIVMIAISAGRPPGWMVPTTFLVASVFVLWMERRREKQSQRQRLPIGLWTFIPRRSVAQSGTLHNRTRQHLALEIERLNENLIQTGIRVERISQEELSLQIYRARIRHAEWAFNLAWGMTAASAVFGLAGVSLLLAGKVQAGAITVAGGAAAVVMSRRLAKDANDLLDKLAAKMDDNDSPK